MKSNIPPVNHDIKKRDQGDSVIRLSRTTTQDDNSVNCREQQLVQSNLDVLPGQRSAQVGRSREKNG